MRPAPDVLVVGAGPAGSATAALLADRGFDVLIVDRARFPRPKPCGECVSPGAVAALARLGFLGAVERLAPAHLHGWHVRGAGASGTGRFGPGEYGLGVARSDFDHALLLEARRRGARSLHGVRVEDVRSAEAEGRPEVVLRGADGLERIRPRVVVGADGLRSRVARALGAVGRPPRLRKTSLTCRLEWPGGGADGGLLDVADGVTLGLAPVDAAGRRWNATVVVDAERADALAALRDDGLGFVGRTLDARLGADPGRTVVDGPWASGPFDRPVRRPWAPGVALVGDAAGYWDPFTGQGIYRALRSAELAAEAVAACLAAPGEPRKRLEGGRAPTTWAPLAEYGRQWRREGRAPRGIQRVVEAVASRPRLWRRVVPRLDTAGALDTLVRVTGDAAPVSCLFRPSWWLPVLTGTGRRPSSHAPHPPC